LQEDIMAENEVWGFAIQTTPSGRNIWPNELKWEATRRIREDGLSPGDVAAELGAHECLVRKWWVADRRQRGEKIKVEGPAFAEISVGNNIQAVESSAPSCRSTGFGRVHCGLVNIEFPLGIAEADLIKLIQVAGSLNDRTF
jgi:transposase-like protein